MSEGGEGTAAGTPETPGTPGTGPGVGGGAGGSGDDDVAGLKSALEKERQAVKDLKAQMKELGDLAKKAKDADKIAEQLEGLKGKLGEYEFRDARDAALGKAIEVATKDGKFEVDADKARRLVAKLANRESLEADVAEIVETLKAEKREEQKLKDPALKGQPAKNGSGKTTEVPYADWARLKREDPEAYDEMIKSRRGAVPFGTLNRA